MPSDEPGSTAIVVATPQADAVTGALYRLYSKAGREAMFPHVTLLVPFVAASAIDEDVEARLRAVLQRFAPFEYSLERPARFPEGVLYLAPEPAAPFVELVRALSAEFPEQRPYDGIHETIVPHATVAVSDDRRLLDRLERELASKLPITGRVVEVTIVERGDDLRWRLRSAHPLGSVKSPHRGAAERG